MDDQRQDWDPVGFLQMFRRLDQDPLAKERVRAFAKIDQHRAMLTDAGASDYEIGIVVSMAMVYAFLMDGISEHLPEAVRDALVSNAQVLVATCGAAGVRAGLRST